MKNTLLKLILYILGILTGFGIVLLCKEWVAAVLIWLIFK